MVKVKSVEYTGHRAKAIYQITETGELEFKRLLKESFERSSVILPSSLYTAVSFLHEISNEDLQEAVHGQLRTLERELDDLKAGQELKEKAIKIDPLTKLAFENMYQHYEIQMNYLTQIKEYLKDSPAINKPVFPESK